MINLLWQQRKFRFVCVGVFNTVFDFTLLNSIIIIFGLPALFANVISASIAITVSYFLNHYIVFRHHEPPSKKNALKFFIITGVSVLVIQSLVIAVIGYGLEIYAASFLNWAVALIHNSVVTSHIIAANIAKACAVLAGMLWNFVLYKNVVFEKQENS